MILSAVSLIVYYISLFAIHKATEADNTKAIVVTFVIAVMSLVVFFDSFIRALL